jgi:hypothetical protein
MRKAIVSFLFVLLTFNISATDIWVSPDGSGNAYCETNPGSMTNNLQLKNKIKSLRNAGIKNIRVLLKEGVYYLNTPVSVDSDMAGSATDTLSFIGIATNPATSEGKATLSGGRKVTGWQPAGNGIYQAQLPAGANFRQLYVNGKMAIRARYPNRDNDTNYGPFWHIKSLTEEGSIATINASEISAWRNITDVEMSIIQTWTHTWVKVKSASVAGSNAYVSLSILPPYSWGNSNLPYFWENSPDFLDVEDEWYFDKSTNVLSYKPRAGEDINQIDVVYPVIDRVLNIAGTASAPVSNVTMQNIEFIYGNWTAPSINGVCCDQAAQPFSGVRVETLIRVNYADKIRFTNCNIFCTGDDGITFNTGVKNSVIEACHFDQISANAILIDNDRTMQQQGVILCSDNQIVHNLIENFAMNYYNGLGIAAFHVDRLAIEHNEICYSRYSGLQISNADDLMHDNMIRYNNIHDVLWLLGDCAGVYTKSDQPGSKISENWIHHLALTPWMGGVNSAIGLDDYSGHFLVENNVFNALSAGVTTIEEQTHFDADRNAHDNIFRNNDSQDPYIMNTAGPKMVTGVTVCSIEQ